MKVKSNPRPNLHSRTWEEFGLNLEPLKLDHIYKVLDLRDQFEVSEAEIPSFKNFWFIGPNLELMGLNLSRDSIDPRDML